MKRKGLGAWLAALGGALWCSSYIRPLLNPLRLDVVLQSDWAQHTLGWLFYRRESLSFPLGALHGFVYPLGTTLGYMDSIPWVALVLRPFDALLPRDFQYLGLWMVFCSAMVAWAASRVAALSTKHWEQQALAGLLVGLTPSLVDRIVHPALCAHFLIVLAIALHLAPSNTPSAARRTLYGAFALLCLSTATHPYIAFMVLGILIGLPWMLLRRMSFGVVLAASIGMAALLLSELVLFGYVGGSVQNATGGFGEFSANLNTLFNSEGYSRLFPELPIAPLQYEGFSYLGAGVFLLGAVVIGLLLVRRTRAGILSFPWRRAVWPLMAAIGLAVFALATPWMWGEKTVLDIGLYAYIEWLTAVFRSSGRLIWALAYLITLALITAVLRGLRARRVAASAVLFAAVALQLYDLDTARVQSLFAPQRTNRYAASAWSSIDGSFKHLALYPAEIAGVCESPGGYRANHVNGLAYLAYRHGLTFNSGYVARVHRDAEKHCHALKSQVRRGQLQADTIYVVRRRDVSKFVKAGATCGRLNGANVCVQAREHPFARYLAQHKR